MATIKLVYPTTFQTAFDGKPFRFEQDVPQDVDAEHAAYLLNSSDHFVEVRAPRKPVTITNKKTKTDAAVVDGDDDSVGI